MLKAFSIRQPTGGTEEPILIVKYNNKYNILPCTGVLTKSICRILLQ